jgi:type 1 glutamine amidotransferase
MAHPKLVATALLVAPIWGCLASDTEVAPTVASTAPPAAPTVAAPPRVLIYNKETEWIHLSTPVAEQVITDRGRARGWTVTASKDSAVFTPDNLKSYDVIAFLNSSGMTMDQTQRDAFASWIASGHGWVGAHAASHTDYDWSFMRDVVGTSFCCHPPVTPANVNVQDAADPIVSHLPSTWNRADEWYTYDKRPEDNPRIHVLLTMDESSVRPDYPGPDLPAVLRVGYHATTWKQQFGATRVFYTGMGHTVESWQDENYILMILKAIEWAAGADKLSP